MDIEMFRMKILTKALTSDIGSVVYGSQQSTGGDQSTSSHARWQERVELMYRHEAELLALLQSRAQGRSAI
jgi:hypothetical protein